MFHSVSLFSQALLACGSRALPSVLFSFFVHLHGQTEQFGSCSSLALLSSSVSTTNLSCSLSTTFSSFRFLSSSLSSSLQFFESGRALFLVVYCFRMFASYPQPFFPLVSEALFALSFSFLSERSFRPC